MRSQCAVYAKQYAGRGACFQVQSVLAKLSLCRTRALGGQVYRCDDCEHEVERFHSCGDRHCPQCSGCKRFDFAERAERLILEGVTYYQVVFTLPGELSELALANRESMADLLFDSAAASLRKTIRREQDFDYASMMVLHTWNQRLQPHWHVHALVSGGGPSLSKDQWKSAESPPGAINSDDFYLVDAINLRESYRKTALRRLRKLYDEGQLQLGGKFAYLQDESKWTAFCDQLSERDWVSYIQPPPTKSCSAEQVVRYLTRYLTGGPISDNRIVAADTTEVTFMAREGKRVGGEREQLPVTVSTLEFVRRWCDHIQPDQLTKTRYFGGWCSRKRTQYQARCRPLLGICDELEGESMDMPASTSPGDIVCGEPPMRCPVCEGTSLGYVRQTPQPSWLEVLSHLDPRCPSWYAETERAEFCEYLEREYGIGYEDWYLELGIESTMTRSVFAPARQLYLPGLMTAEDQYLLESY